MTTANAARPEDQGDAAARMTDCPDDGPVPRRVLVVDDDDAIRESLARALELEGYHVAVVLDGVAALARTRRDVDPRGRPDDARHRRPEGLSSLAGREGPDTGADAHRPDRDPRPGRGLDAGADDYLPKPFDSTSCSLGFARCCGGPSPRRSGAGTTPLRRRPPRRPRRPPGLVGQEDSSCPRPSSTSSSCWRATRASRSTTRRSTSASGATTSAPTPRTCRSTSATCAASSPRPGPAADPHRARRRLRPSQAVRSVRQLGATVREHLRANLRTRFALAFATVAAVADLPGTAHPGRGPRAAHPADQPAHQRQRPAPHR